MKKFLDADHPFFAPVWRRWVTVISPMIWGGVELSLGSPGWAALFGAAGAWAYWELIWKGPSNT
jgi:hypothetical protein